MLERQADATRQYIDSVATCRSGRKTEYKNIRRIYLAPLQLPGLVTQV